MKKLLLTLVCCCSFLLLPSCVAVAKKKVVRATGELVQKNLPYTGIRSIEASSRITVELIQSENESTYLVAPKDILPYLRTQKEGDELIIDLKPDIIYRVEQPIKVVVNTRSIRKLELSGASEALLNGHFSTDLLNIELSGSSSIKEMDLECKSLECELSGASQLKGSILCTQMEVELSGASEFVMNGKCDQMKLDSSGASSFSGEKLATTTASIEMGGAGNTSVGVTKELSYDLSGASSLIIFGNPRILKSEVGGSSSIRFL
ncbi:MAG: head GIN domain-containing protein [Porphyromonas sp.]|nr:head GIN domain-containing protein [Porphyromonas sp.]